MVRADMWPDGTKVVCIDDNFPAWAKKLYAALPKAGNTYTIRGTTVGVSYGPGFADRQEGEIAVYLREIVNPKSGKAPFREFGFKAERFKPLEEDVSWNTESEPEFEPAEKELVTFGKEDEEGESWKGMGKEATGSMGLGLGVGGRLQCARGRSVDWEVILRSRRARSASPYLGGVGVN